MLLYKLLFIEDNSVNPKNEAEAIKARNERIRAQEADAQAIQEGRLPPSAKTEDLSKYSNTGKKIKVEKPKTVENRTARQKTEPEKKATPLEEGMAHQDPTKLPAGTPPPKEAEERKQFGKGWFFR